MSDDEFLHAFISDYSDVFNDCMFGGDVFIVDADQRRMWIFHHEGRFNAFDLQSF